jgi:hypothetical protein
MLYKAKPRQANETGNDIVQIVRDDDLEIKEDGTEKTSGSDSVGSGDSDGSDSVNTSGKAAAQIPHLPLGDDSSPWGR